MKAKFKIGDRALIKKFGYNPFHVTVIGMKKGLFGYIYYEKHNVHDLDGGGHYQSTGTFRWRNVILKEE